MLKYNKQTYKLILESAINTGYEFTDYLSVDFSKGRQIILRHDIDCSLEMALEMARIDASYNIKSTFAVLLSSPLYNPFTPENIFFINEIHLLGHDIALHTESLNTREIEINQKIEKEMQVMKHFFPYIQPIFIWHNPQNNLLSHIKVPNIVNAYDLKYIKEMHYISDSVLRRTPEEFLECMGKYNLIYLLLHPILWMAERNNMVNIVSYVITRIVRSVDKEFSVNNAWKERFPNGLPEEILENIEKIIIGDTL